MNALFLVVATISLLFVVLLAVKEIARTRIKKEFCVICAAVSLTWIGLLAANLLGIFEDKTLIALLMGQSVVGIFYLVESKAAKNLKLFRLPFLLTLTTIAYIALQVPQGSMSAILSVIFLLAALWTAFIFLYLYKNNKNVHSVVKRIVKCCRNW